MIEIDINIGDTIYTGKFRNKPTVVKNIKYDEFGLPLVNGKKIVNFKIKKETEMEEGRRPGGRELNKVLSKQRDVNWSNNIKYKKELSKKLNVPEEDIFVFIANPWGVDFKIKNSDAKGYSHYDPRNGKIQMKEDSLSGGKGDNKNSNKFDKAELRVGITVEMEHTNDKKKALEIAIDHLSEKSNYYSELIKSGLVDEKPALKLAKKLGMIDENEIIVEDNRFKGPNKLSASDVKHYTNILKDILKVSLKHFDKFFKNNDVTNISEKQMENEFTDFFNSRAGGNKFTDDFEAFTEVFIPEKNWNDSDTPTYDKGRDKTFTYVSSELLKLAKKKYEKIGENKMNESELRKLIREEIKNQLVIESSSYVKKLSKQVTELDAEEMEDFFDELYIYFRAHLSDLDNMDAASISKLLAQIGMKIKNRTGN